jgi:hypothetical protein
MAQRVLIPLPGLGTLALDEETYRRALEEGARFNPLPEPDTDPSERLLDSQQLADVLQAPVTWIEQQARAGNIPSGTRADAKALERKFEDAKRKGNYVGAHFRARPSPKWPVCSWMTGVPTTAA